MSPQRSDIGVKGRTLHTTDGGNLTSTAAGSKRPIDVLLYDASGNPLSETVPVFVGAAIHETEVTPTNIETTYNNVTTTATSGAITRKDGCLFADVMLSLDKANSPTRIQFYIEGVRSATGHPWGDGWESTWIYSSSTIGSGLEETVRVRLPSSDTYQIRAVATGTTATDTITLNYFRIFEHSNG